MARLLPCPCCERHVRISEPLCPFCGEALPLSYQSAGPAPLPTGRLSRAAKFAFGAAAVAGALTVTACGDDGRGPSDATTGDTSISPDTSVADTGGGGDADLDSAVPPDGAPVDAAADGGSDAAIDSGSMALYGGPPGDAGVLPDSAAMLDGGAVPLYGAPPAEES